jgi:hypothetical protein
MGVFGSSWQNGIQRFVTSGGFPNPVPNVIAMWQSPSVVTVANSVAETNLLTGAVSTGTLNIPANYLSVGTCIRVIMRGYIQTAASVPTGQLRVTFGGTTIYNTTPIAVATAQITTPAAVECDLEIGARTIGATGNIACSGVLWTSSLSSIGLSPTTDQSGAIDTTTQEAIAVLWTWGTADPSNSIKITSAVVEIMG